MQFECGGHLRVIDADTALDILKQHRRNGFNVDGRLVQEIHRPGKLFAVSLAAQADLFSLVWQSVDDTRPLTPVGQPRTIRDCAERLRVYDWSFARLRDAGFPWFEKCVEIDSAFDYAKFGWVALVPTNEDERQESPTGTYYVFDGVHKTMVLAKKLMRNEILYQGVEALLLTPRR